jgi:hypothetical protein
MEHGVAVNKYQVTARFREGIVEWALSLELENGEKHEIVIKDGSEIPVLLDMARRDATIYFDPQRQRLSTGWNDPGS